MPTLTYTPIATLTLTSSDSEVVFSSIPATYRDLILTFDAAVSGGSTQNTRVRVNGDTGSNYYNVIARGNGSSTGSLSYNWNAFFTSWYTDIPSAVGQGITIMQFMDYSATDKHKSVLSRANVAANGVNMTAARWANTAAITSIAVGNDAGNWLSGSTFSLWGIAA